MVREWVCACERQRQPVSVVIGHELETPERPNTHRMLKKVVRVLIGPSKEKGLVSDYALLLFGFGRANRRVNALDDGQVS